MEGILGILLFLLLISGANVLRWWIEKQQREKEAEERQHGAVPRPPSAAYPGRRPVFYGRPGEKPPLAEAPAEASRLQTMVLPEMERQEPWPTPARPAGKPTRRQATRRPAMSHPAPQPESAKPLVTTKPTAAPVAATQKTPFLGGLLEGRNVARAIVLSEILGPPKALRDS
jgi:hypothetical protein